MSGSGSWKKRIARLRRRLFERSSPPPPSSRKAAQAVKSGDPPALRLSGSLEEQRNAVLDARLAALEVGDTPEAIEAVVAAVNAASPEALTPSDLSQVAAGLPLATIGRLKRAGEIEWIAAQNKLRKADREGKLTDSMARRTLRSFTEANYPTLDDPATWRSMLNPVLRGRR